MSSRDSTQVLNAVLRNEYTVLTQVFTHSLVFKYWGITGPASRQYDIAVEDQRRCMRLLLHMLSEGMVPSYHSDAALESVSWPHLGGSIGEILDRDRAQFELGVRTMRAAAAHCEACGDAASAGLLGEFISGQERDLEWTIEQSRRAADLGGEDYARQAGEEAANIEELHQSIHHMDPVQGGRELPAAEGNASPADAETTAVLNDLYNLELPLIEQTLLHAFVFYAYGRKGLAERELRQSIQSMREMYFGLWHLMRLGGTPDMGEAPRVRHGRAPSGAIDDLLRETLAFESNVVPALELLRERCREARSGNLIDAVIARHRERERGLGEALGGAVDPESHGAFEKMLERWDVALPAALRGA